MSHLQFGSSHPTPSTPLASSPLLMTGSAPAPPTSGSSTCCENGRPIMTDPHTGQTVCSCQYPTSLLSAAYASRVPGITDSMYSSYAAQGYVPFGTDPSAFYSPLNPTGQTAMGYPYDPTMAGYPYGAYGGMDLNSAAHRKNATREATSTLKAWLYEHRKNPYPTKGEKIMLAIITKMTLTQVSTWFANARRRLKKENKMTWSPRNRCGDEDDDDDADRDKLDSEGEEENNNDSHSESKVNGHSESKKDEDDDEDIIIDPANDKDDGASEEKEQSNNMPTLNKMSPIVSPLSSGHVLSQCHRVSSSSSTSPKTPVLSSANTSQTSTSESSTVTKPRIWSLADVATSNTPSSGRKSPSSLPHVTMTKPGHPYPSPMNSLRQWVDTAYSVANHSVLSHPYALAPPSVSQGNPAVMSYSSAGSALTTMSRFGMSVPTGLYPALHREPGKAIPPSLSERIRNSPISLKAPTDEEQKTAFKPVPKRSPLL